MESKKVSVIIVSHNNKDILPKCLDGLRNQSFKNFEVLLLDNDSTDGTEEFIKNKYPEIKFITVSEGPSEKRNIGISQSDLEYIVTLDSDVIISKDWIKKAVEYLNKHKDVGICGGKLIDKDGLIDFAGGVISKSGGGSDIGHGEKDSSRYNTFKRVSFITTAALIMRRKVIEDIGGFDKDYFYGYEDAELSLRANLSGWKVIYNPDLIGDHLYHSTVSKQPKEFIKYLIIRNRLLMLLKNFEFKTLVINSPFILSSMIKEMIENKLSTIIKSYSWIFNNLGKINKARKEIFNKRKLKDKELFELIDFPTPGLQEGEYFSFFKKITNKSVKNLFFFVTSRCNSKCQHCFYWDSLQKSKDLTLDEISTILSKFHNIKSVVLSGGEPFIRKDLVEVVDLIVKYTDTRHIFIPTNCLINFNDKFEIMLKKHPHVKFIICASLDGLKEDHDTIRGVKGGFEKTLDQIFRLKKLRKKYPNFVSIVVNTVITNKNYDNLEKFINFVKTLPVDDHSFDIIRGDHQTVIGPPNVEKLKKISQLRYNTSKYYTKKENFLKRLYLNLKTKEFIKTHIRVMEGGKWPFKCNAGTTDFIIESDGSARVCELQPKIGNLLDKTPEELLKTDQAKKIFEQINNHECDCTHICILSSSLDRSPKNIFFDRIVGSIFPLKNK